MKTLSAVIDDRVDCCDDQAPLIEGRGTLKDVERDSGAVTVFDTFGFCESCDSKFEVAVPLQASDTELEMTGE